MIKILLSIIFVWSLTIKNINGQLLAKADKIEKQENGLTKYTDSFNNFVWYTSKSIIIDGVGIRIVGMFRKNLLTPGLLDPKLVNGNTLYLWMEFSFEEKKYVKNITILYDNNYKDVVFDNNDSNVNKYNYDNLLYSKTYYKYAKKIRPTTGNYYTYELMNNYINAIRICYNDDIVDLKLSDVDSKYIKNVVNLFLNLEK